MSACFTHRAPALVLTAETIAFFQKTPAAPKPEPPVPKTVAGAINQTKKLSDAKKFADAIAVLEARQKALGTKMTPREKRALLVAAADTHSSWAEAEKKLYKWKEAIKHYQSAYVIDKNYRPKSAADELASIGEVFFYSGDPTKALTFFNKALPIQQQALDKKSEAATLNNIGYVYSNLGENTKALAFYNKALPLLQQLGSKTDVADALSNIGMVYTSLGKNSDALNVFNQALLLGSKRGQANTLNNLGMVYDNLGEKPKALEFYNKALLLFQRLGDKAGEANTLNNLGFIYDNLGEKAKALVFYNKAFPLQQKTGDKSGEATTFSNIGAVYGSLGQQSKMLEFFNRALPLLRQVGDNLRAARLLSNIGFVYQGLGDSSKALKYYNQALPLHQQVGDKSGESATLNNIGFVYYGLDEQIKALEFYNKALWLSQQIGDKSGEAGTLNNIGKVYNRLGDQTKALELYKKGLPLQQQVGDKAGEATTAGNLMRLFSDPKSSFRNDVLAITFGKQSVNLFQSLRANIKTLDKGVQATFSKKVEPTYRKLADILISLSRLPEALQILGLLKDQEFADLFPGENNGGANAQADLTPRETAAQNRYNAASAKIAALVAQTDTLKGEIRLEPTPARNARLADLTRQQDAARADFGRVVDAVIADGAAKPNLALDTLQTTRDADAFTKTLQTLDTQTGKENVAVYTLVAPENLHCLVITPTSLVARTTPIKSDAVSKLVKDFRTALEDPHLDPRPVGKQLYDLIVGPVKADLNAANAQSVLWSLDGTLRYVPLAALSPDGKTYLAEQSTHSLFIPAALPGLSDAAKPTWSVAAFGVTGGRTEDGIPFRSLPGVPAEIKAIEKTVPTRSFLDAAFTESTFRAALAGGPPVVHIASHFALRPNNPDGSFLLLGKGTLSLSAIAKSRARLFGGVELLTLSACNTASGGGADENGVEVESFALLAQKKGAGAVLASLWPVNDTSTQALMQTFYALHKANPSLGKAECLRQTQVAFLTGAVKPSLTGRGAEGNAPPSATDAASAPFVPDANAPCAHPYYWAAFTLFGNTK